MRTEREIKGKICMFLKVLEHPGSLPKFHREMLKKQIKELQWVLGEGTEIRVSDEYLAELPDLLKKLKKKLI